MKIPTIRDLVRADKNVFFTFYRDGELWYKTHDDGNPGRFFEFPIPAEDMRGALFKPEDKSIIFMRFIRKHLEFLAESMKAEEV